jgi:6-pyruvoyltetrahydropterin/6-carboxytetrahydropterin synthase
MYRSIRVEVGFCYGHRLTDYEGKCARLHGHQGTVDVALASRGLDKAGMVFDFGVIKRFVKGWVDENWDHRMILNEADPIVAAIRPHDAGLHVVPYNPTAENLSAKLYHAIEEWLSALPEDQNPGGAELISVKFWETPTSSVVCYGDGVALEGVLCGQEEGRAQG